MNMVDLDPSLPSSISVVVLLDWLALILPKVTGILQAYRLQQLAA